MELVGGTGEPAKRPRRARGRKDANKQEAVINRQEVFEKTEYLVGLHGTARDAAKDFSEAIKAVAEKSGMNASAVRRYVVAKAGENFDAKRRDVTQLALLFDVDN